MVSVHIFYSDNPSLIPSDIIIVLLCYEKPKNDEKDAGVGVFNTNYPNYILYI